jgi:pantetheine-phosphate adenylyltransferase
MSIIKAIFKNHFKDINDELISDIEKRYNESWRYYHTLKHIEELYKSMISYTNSIGRYAGVKIEYQNNKSLKKLALAIIYHDVVYYPWKKDNEEKSVEYFVENLPIPNSEENKSIISWVCDAIEATKAHKSTTEMNSTDRELLEQFLSWDMSIVNSDDAFELLEWERNIWKEYSFAPTTAYKTERINFLQLCQKQYECILTEKLIEHVQNFRPKVGFYAGSFNPFHVGHLSIVEQARQVYDKVVVLIGQNPSKPKIEEDVKLRRKQQIFSHIPGIEVEFFNGFLSEYLKKRNEHEDVYLVRGVRNTEDWAAEANFLRYSQDLWKDLKVQYFTCPKEIEHVSSSGIRALEVEEKGSSGIYIPEEFNVL